MSDFLSHTGKYELQVQAVIALLDEVNTARVKEIWSLLNVECGLKAIHSTPFPHFSFHIAESYDQIELDARLTELTARMPVFTVRTTGLSIFTGPEPVVYVPLVPTLRLIQVHQTLWEQTAHLGRRVSSHYQPGSWMAHITLANKDVTAENIGCVAHHLVNRSFEWEIEVRQLAVVCQEDGVAKIGPVYTLQPA